MRWEYLVPRDFKRAVEEHGLCIVPTGSLERHGEHLPFGCDMIITHTIACRAAEIEPAVVFPPYFMMQVHEAACFTGTVNFPQAFAIEALSLLLKSIASNGFKKILIVNGHGGNRHMLDYFAMSRLDEPTDYILYYTNIGEGLTSEERARINSLWETDVMGHACEMETSLFMACCPGKAKLEYAPQNTVEPLRRFKHLWEHGVHNALWWYADYPENVVGNASYASEEKGKVVLDIYVAALARAIKAVKEDKEAPRLQAEFTHRMKNKGTGE
ncbi:creatinine amidohydrolase [Caldicoprobacter guelmensis]|uniref:creatininase family protein n=1 Tax=Caldicoprobacter guelmensis TaxID=1170224 RepID=UPI001957F990|nr:creatininase family protein [Caldicoprobacter guelmensis]MBM7581538.1 creatinine amidohydrolase [Caldicoprobacter guelmensis]